MSRDTITYILRAEACLFIGLLICIIIRPEGLRLNEGVSYYGVFGNTIIPYTFALAGSSLYCFLCAYTAKTDHLFKTLTYLICIFLLGVLLTPDTLSRTFNQLHVIFGALLFITQLILSLRIIFKMDYDLTAVILFGVELTGGILAFIFLKYSQGLLLQSQILFQIGFGLLIIYYFDPSIRKLFIVDRK